MAMGVAREQAMEMGMGMGSRGRVLFYVECREIVDCGFHAAR